MASQPTIWRRNRAAVQAKHEEIRKANEAYRQQFVDAAKADEEARQTAAEAAKAAKQQQQQKRNQNR